MMMNKQATKQSTSSSSSKTLKNIDLDSQIVDLTDNGDENMPPPVATISLKRPQQQQQRKLPLQVASKKMLLPYETATKPVTFFGYKMYYLARTQHLVFKSKVKLFQCNNTLSTTDIRLGVADIDGDDRMSLMKLLNNVSGSLPITVKNVRRPIEEGDDVLFVSLKRGRGTIFDHHGVIMAFDKMPKVCEAKLALQVSGMKVKDDDASFIVSVEQILVKKPYGGKKGQQQEPPKLLFDVSSDSSDEEEMMMVE